MFADRMRLLTTLPRSEVSNAPHPAPRPTVDDLERRRGPPRPWIEAAAAAAAAAKTAPVAAAAGAAANEGRGGSAGGERGNLRDSRHAAAIQGRTIPFTLFRILLPTFPAKRSRPYLRQYDLS